MIRLKCLAVESFWWRVIGAGLLLAMGCGGISPRALGVGPGPFDPRPWLEDLAQVREAMGSKYANLEWVVVERGVDLPALFSDASRQIEVSNTESEARDAMNRLARRLGDGHVRFRWPTGPTMNIKQSTCQALGYNDDMQGPPLAALAPGYAPLGGTSIPLFPVGLLSAAGHRIGVIKIGLFSPQGYPSLCSGALVALGVGTTARCDERCADRVETWGFQRMTEDLAAGVGRIRSAGADILLVDVAGNGGGTEWAEVAARMISPRGLESPRMSFVRGPHWAAKFARMASDLRAAAGRAQPEDRAFLLTLASEAETRQNLAQGHCDSTPLWLGRRLECPWVQDAFFSSGLVSSDTGRTREKGWASLVFHPAAFEYQDRLWKGPLIVLMDAGTGSAAAQFAAILQDNRAGTLMGSPAKGGCGQTDGGTPTTLSHSGAVFEVPDCVRYRADGSNQMNGIQPDVTVKWSPNDLPVIRATRVLERMPDAVHRAIQ